MPTHKVTWKTDPASLPELLDKLDTALNQVNASLIDLGEFEVEVTLEIYRGLLVKNSIKLKQ